tara:strand:- start:1652 stop:2305 length:654 start_codon:yes stop_codon:yes gene_type:complete
MRQIVLFITVAFAFSLSANAQFTVNGEQTILIAKEAEDIPVVLQGIQYKKYLTKDYKSAQVDDLKDQAFLRYNIYEDQMEFIKGNQIYYLKKDVGRTVRFTNNQKYEVFEVDGNLNFLLVLTEGKKVLVTKQIVKYVDALEPNSGYDRGRPADYKRKKDEFYLATEKGLTKLPRNKKNFLKVFGSKSSTIKAFMKKNKLSYKKLPDLKKVVQHFDSL